MNKELFVGTTEKLEDARLALRQLRSARDAQATRAAFNSFLAHSRSITFALQKDGAHIAGFDDWYSEKRAEMAKDELLQFLKNARNDNLKQGKQYLRFRQELSYLGPVSFELPADEDFKCYQFVYNSLEGPYAILDPETPRERRVPVEIRGDHDMGALVVELVDPPRTHMGRDLQQVSPESACVLALEYFEYLVFEVRREFES